MKSLYHYHQDPSLKLKDYIDTYWVVKNQTDKSVKIPIVPDGCIDIVSKNGQIFLVGLMEIASVKTIEPSDYYIGIRFKPSAISVLVEQDISIYNDKMIPFERMMPFLHEQLFELFTSSTDIFERLDKVFEAHFVDKNLDKRVVLAINEIESSDGSIGIKELSQKMELSQRQLSRLFIGKVGLTPKKFARVIRFFHTHKYLTDEGMSDLCMKVLGKGYYDQAHFNREYKILTGVNPNSEIMSIFYNT